MALYLHHNGDAPRTSYKIDSRFENIYEVSWMEHPLVAEIVMSIDKMPQISPLLYDSPIQAPVGPGFISGGAKTLIAMLAEPEVMYPMQNLGDNCAYALSLVAKEVDCHMCFNEYLIDFWPDTPIISADTGTHMLGKDAKRIGREEGWY